MPNGAVVQSSEGYNGATISVTWQNFFAGSIWSVVHIVGSAGPAEIDHRVSRRAIPVWGPARASSNDYQHGRWIWGTLNYVLAVTNVFLVRSIITSTVKIIGKGAGGSSGREDNNLCYKGGPKRAAPPRNYKEGVLCA